MWKGVNTCEHVILKSAKRGYRKGRAPPQSTSPLPSILLCRHQACCCLITMCFSYIFTLLFFIFLYLFIRVPKLSYFSLHFQFSLTFLRHPRTFSNFLRRGPAPPQNTSPASTFVFTAFPTLFHTFSTDLLEPSSTFRYSTTFPNPSMITLWFRI